MGSLREDWNKMAKSGIFVLGFMWGVIFVVVITFAALRIAALI